MGAGMQQKWEVWNQILTRIIAAWDETLVLERVAIGKLRELMSAVPDGTPRLEELRDFIRAQELTGEGSPAEGSPKSLANLLRYFPAFEAYLESSAFTLKDGMFGFRVRQQVDSAWMRLDLTFEDHSQIGYSFIEGGKGECHIRGTACLTDYLSNSQHIDKLLSLLDPC